MALPRLESLSLCEVGWALNSHLCLSPHSRSLAMHEMLKRCSPLSRGPGGTGYWSGCPQSFTSMWKSKPGGRMMTPSAQADAASALCHNAAQYNTPQHDTQTHSLTQKDTNKQQTTQHNTPPQHTHNTTHTTHNITHNITHTT